MNLACWQANGVEGISSDAETRLRHLGESAELHVTDGRLSRGVGYATASQGARQALARAGAILRLRRHNRFFVHASGVVNTNGSAFIFVGESGSGKSTLAFALARRGWAVLGDDGVVLEPLANSILVHAWRSRLLVSESLSKHFPELAEHRGQVLAGDERRRIPFEVSRAEHAPLGAIVFLKRGSEGLLQRCGQAIALVSLIRESPLVLLGDAASSAHFEALGRIVATVPVFEFTHGPAELVRIGDFFDSAA